MGYPRSTARQRMARASELAGLGIESVLPAGPTMLGRTPVLGKGYSGVVVLGRDARGRRRAVKIRRTDSQRTSMRGERELLAAANAAGVGPRLDGATRNFLVMSYVGGERIGAWVAGLGGRGAATRLKAVARRILTDCHRLDRAGIDHGELSNITKHIIVTKDDRPVLIDFESASTNRRPANVTSVAQAIYISSPIARTVRKLYRCPPRDAVIGRLREYKRTPDTESFKRLLRTLRL